MCPSLPGYGFSGKPSRTGWSVEKIAEAWATLMGRLGYDRYGAQGGDWGSAITTQMGRNGGRLHRYSRQHAARFPDGREHAEPHARGEAAALAALGEHTRWGTGYSEEQATRPQTLGYGLTDSPVGPAGLDRREVLGVDRLRRSPRERPDPRRDARQRDALLGDRLRRRRRPGCTGRASRASVDGGPRSRCRPAWRVVPQGDPAVRRAAGASRSYNITHWTDMPRGGHFAAFEQPELFVDDVRAFFATVR